MNSSNRTTKGFFRFGKYTTDVIEFNSDTNMVDIYGYIYQSFNNIIPSTFHVEFYSVEAKKIFRLDGDLLGSEYNPFRSNSTDNSQETTSIMDCVQLLVVDDSLPNDQINSGSETLLDTILSSDLDDALFNTALSVDLNDVLILSSSSPNRSNEVIPQNNISTYDVDNDNTEDDSVAENSLNSQIDSQNSNASSNEYQIATQPNDENNTQSIRIYFSHDVQPGQKHHYLSNKYNIDDGSDENGGISYIQGVKTEEEIKKKLQVLPHLLIPQLYRKMEKLELLIYAVFEEKENGMRIWYKNRHKGFLLHGEIKPDAEFLNPIKLNLNNNQWKNNGDYILEIYMLTKLDKKLKNKEEIYRLDENAVLQLHKAEHIISSKRKHLKPTRLLAVLAIGDGPCWKTCGLSNFIQPPIKSPQSVALNGNTTVQIALPTPNINLNAVGLSAIFQPSTENFQPMGLNAIATVQIKSPAFKRKKV